MRRAYRSICLSLLCLFGTGLLLNLPGAVADELRLDAKVMQIVKHDEKSGVVEFRYKIASNR